MARERENRLSLALALVSSALIAEAAAAQGGLKPVCVVEEAKLFAADAKPQDWFGVSCGLDGDIAAFRSGTVDGLTNPPSA